MDKFLFTDGTTGVREVQSEKELEALIESSTHPERIRIWLFSSNEWINYAAFRKQVPAIIKKEKISGSSYKPSTSSHTMQSEGLQPATSNQQPAHRSRGLRKFLYLSGAAAGIFLVFNFTKIKWEKAGPVNAGAARPLNVPFMDIDSLIWEIETTRGQSVDRTTKNNLRLRNTWPERILLQVAAEKETSNAGTRFFNVAVTIDNTTGHNVDKAVVKLSVWNNKKVSLTDTLHFNSIRYDKLSARQLDARYKGDSISVAFETLKAKAFNFCYAAATKNNSGNYNDRWFCRE